MKIHEIRRKSSEDKKPAWNRAKVSRWAAVPPLTVVPGFKHPCPPNHWKFIKMQENLWNTMKVFRRQEASHASPPLTVAPRIKHPCSEIHENRWNLRSPWKSMKNDVNPCNTMKVLRGQETSRELSNTFDRSSRSFLTILEHYMAHIHENHETILKSMKHTKIKYDESL